VLDVRNQEGSLGKRCKPHGQCESRRQS